MSSRYDDDFVAQRQGHTMQTKLQVDVSTMALVKAAAISKLHL